MTYPFFRGEKVGKRRESVGRSVVRYTADVDIFTLLCLSEKGGKRESAGPGDLLFAVQFSRAIASCIMSLCCTRNNNYSTIGRAYCFNDSLSRITLLEKQKARGRRQIIIRFPVVHLFSSERSRTIVCFNKSPSIVLL